MRRIEAYDSDEEMLHVALSEIPAEQPAIDTLAKNYSNGFDPEWYVGRESLNLRYRYDYGQVVPPGTPAHPHSELPDGRTYWNEPEHQKKIKRNQNKPGVGRVHR